MKSRWCICGMLSMLALGAGPAAAAGQPLRIDLAPLMNTPAKQDRPAPRMNHRSFAAPTPTVDERDLRLTDRRQRRQEAISTLGVGLLTGLDSSDASDLTTTTPAQGYPVLKFNKQGHLARDIKQSYRAMGKRLAGRVWDDPRGKRIVFDIQGRPGVGVEIPLKR